ncbi:hypothetical protein GCM10010129_18500 [Streptomyces fumigatiscleroticus]|nr:hypothetical protein GCM10010129_18500 [Streptomyces fumigatiscleroticus]
MYRELRSTSTLSAVAAVSTAVTAAVRGLPPVPEEAGAVAAVVVAFQVLRLLRLLVPVRQSWKVRQFDAAPPLPDENTVTGDSLARHPVVPELSFFFLLLLLAPALLWWPWWCWLFPAWLVTDWLGEAAPAALWERRNGKVLWRGENSADLYVSPRSSPTRTATGAPPA